MTTTLWDIIGRVLRPAQPPTTIAPTRTPRRPCFHPLDEPVGRGFPVRKPRQDSPPALAPSTPNPCSPTNGAAPAPPRTPRNALRTPPLPLSMEDRYEAVTRLMLDRYSIRVRKWRTSMSGIAWCLSYRDGTVKRLIEAPRPRGPMSAAVFLHEIGHHAIGFNVYKPRCLEEYHAWRWSLETMEEQGLNITDQVRYRMHLSLWYAVAKARRRGLKVLPAELEPFTERPRRPRRRAATKAR